MIWKFFRQKIIVYRLLPFILNLILMNIVTIFSQDLME